jgi:anti-anti-sigma regulatory factor
MRITVGQTHNALTIRLEGKLAGLMVDELRDAWPELASELGNRALVVDLRDTIYVDHAGQLLLAEIHHKTGANFQTNSPLTQYFAEQAIKIQNQNEALKGA